MRAEHFPHYSQEFYGPGSEALCAEPPKTELRNAKAKSRHAIMACRRLCGGLERCARGAGRPLNRPAARAGAGSVSGNGVSGERGPVDPLAVGDAVLVSVSGVR